MDQTTQRRRQPTKHIEEEMDMEVLALTPRALGCASANPSANIKMGSSKNWSLHGGWGLALLFLLTLTVLEPASCKEQVQAFAADLPVVQLKSWTGLSVVRDVPEYPQVERQTVKQFVPPSYKIAEQLKAVTVPWNHSWKRRNYVASVHTDTDTETDSVDNSTRDGLIGGMVAIVLSAPIILTRLVNMLVARALARELERASMPVDTQLELVRSGIEPHPGPVVRGSVAYRRLVDFIENLVALDACLTCGIKELLSVDVRVATLGNSDFGTAKRGTRTINSLASYAKRRKFSVELRNGKVNWKVPMRIWDLVLGKNAAIRDDICAFICSRGNPVYAQAAKRNLDFSRNMDTWTTDDEDWHYPIMRYGSIVNASPVMPGLGCSQGAIVAAVSARFAPANMSTCSQEHKLSNKKSLSVTFPWDKANKESTESFKCSKRHVPCDPQTEYWSFRTWLLQNAVVSSEILRYRQSANYELWNKTDSKQLGDLISSTVCVIAPFPTSGSFSDWPLSTVVLRETWDGGASIHDVFSQARSLTAPMLQFWDTERTDVYGLLNLVEDDRVHMSADGPIVRTVLEFQVPSYFDLPAALGETRPIVDVIPFKTIQEWQSFPTEMAAWCNKVLTMVKENKVPDGFSLLNAGLPKAFFELVPRSRNVEFESDICEVFFCCSDFLTYKGATRRPMSTRDLLTIEGVEPNPGPGTKVMFINETMSADNGAGSAISAISEHAWVFKSTIDIIESELTELCDTSFKLFPTYSGTSDGTVLFAYQLNLRVVANNYGMPVLTAKMRTAWNGAFNSAPRKMMGVSGYPHFTDAGTDRYTEFSRPGVPVAWGRAYVPGGRTSVDPITKYYNQAHTVATSTYGMSGCCYETQSDLLNPATTDSRVMVAGVLRYSKISNEHSWSSNEFSLSGWDFNAYKTTGNSTLKGIEVVIQPIAFYGAIPTSTTGNWSDWTGTRLVAVPNLPRYLELGSLYTKGTSEGVTYGNAAATISDEVPVKTNSGTTLNVNTPAGSSVTIAATAAVPVSVAGTVNVAASGNLPVSVNGTVAANVTAAAVLPVSVQSAININPSSVMTVRPENSIPFWTSDTEPMQEFNDEGMNNFDLLALSGDVEPNPGPSVEELKRGYFNSMHRFVMDKVDLLGKKKAFTYNMPEQWNFESFKIVYEIGLSQDAEGAKFVANLYPDFKAKYDLERESQAATPTAGVPAGCLSDVEDMFGKVVSHAVVDSNVPDKGKRKQRGKQHKKEAKQGATVISEKHKAEVAISLVGEILCLADMDDVVATAARIIARFSTIEMTLAQFEKEAYDMLERVRPAVVEGHGNRDDTMSLNSTTPNNPWVKRTEKKEDNTRAMDSDDESQKGEKQKGRQAKLAKAKKLKIILKRFSGKATFWSERDWLLWLSCSTATPQWKLYIFENVCPAPVRDKLTSDCDLTTLVKTRFMRETGNPGVLSKLRPVWDMCCDISDKGVKYGQTGHTELLCDEDFSTLNFGKFWGSKSMPLGWDQSRRSDKVLVFYALHLVNLGKGETELDGITAATLLLRAGIEPNPGPGMFQSISDWLRRTADFAGVNADQFGPLTLVGICGGEDGSEKLEKTINVFVSTLPNWLTSEAIDAATFAAANDTPGPYSTHAWALKCNWYVHHSRKLDSSGSVSIAAPMLVTTAPGDVTSLSASTARQNAINVVMGVYSSELPLLIGGVSTATVFDPTLLYFQGLRYYARRQFTTDVVLADMRGRFSYDDATFATFSAAGVRPPVQQMFTNMRALVDGADLAAYGPNNAWFRPHINAAGAPAAAAVAADTAMLEQLCEYEYAEDVNGGARTAGRSRFFYKGEDSDAWLYFTTNPSLTQVRTGVWADIANSPETRIIPVSADFLTQFGTGSDYNARLNKGLAFFLAMMFPELGMTSVLLSTLSIGGINNTYPVLMPGKIKAKPALHTIVCLPVQATAPVGQAAQATLVQPTWGEAARAMDSANVMQNIAADTAIALAGNANTHRVDAAPYLRSHLERMSASDFKRGLELMWNVFGNKRAWDTAMDIFSYTLTSFSPSLGYYDSINVAANGGNGQNDAMIARAYARCGNGVSCYPVAGAGASTADLTAQLLETGYDFKFKPAGVEPSIVVPLTSYEVASRIWSGLFSYSLNTDNALMPWSDYKQAFVTANNISFFNFIRADGYVKRMTYCKVFDSLPFPNCWYNANDQTDFQLGGLIGAPALAAINGVRWRRNNQTKLVGNLCSALRGQETETDMVSQSASNVATVDRCFSEVYIAGSRLVDTSSLVNVTGAGNVAVTLTPVQHGNGLAGVRRQIAGRYIPQGLCPIVVFRGDSTNAGVAAISLAVDMPMPSPSLLETFALFDAESVGGGYIDVPKFRDFFPTPVKNIVGNVDLWVFSRDELRNLTDKNLSGATTERSSMSVELDRGGDVSVIAGVGAGELMCEVLALFSSTGQAVRPAGPAVNSVVYGEGLPAVGLRVTNSLVTGGNALAALPALNVRQATLALSTVNVKATIGSNFEQLYPGTNWATVTNIMRHVARLNSAANGGGFWVLSLSMNYLAPIRPTAIGFGPEGFDPKAFFAPKDKVIETQETYGRMGEDKSTEEQTAGFGTAAQQDNGAAQG